MPRLVPRQQLRHPEAAPYEPTARSRRERHSSSRGWCLSSSRTEPVCSDRIAWIALPTNRSEWRTRSAPPNRQERALMLQRIRRALADGFAGWLANVGASALLMAGCGERSHPTPTACEPSRAPAPDRPRGVDAAAATRLQGTLDRVRREQELPGAAAAVVVGECEWVGVSGLANVGTREAVRSTTLFAVASVTKPFVAALVLKLAEEGVLGLDDRLSRWVPGFPGSRGITLRQLLNHTSGTADFATDGRFLAAQRRRGLAAGWTPQQLLRYVPAAVGQAGGALELLQHQLPAARPRHRTSDPFDRGTRAAPPAAAARGVRRSCFRARSARAAPWPSATGSSTPIPSPRRTTRTSPAPRKPPAPGPRGTCSRVPGTWREQATGSSTVTCSALDPGRR